MMSESYTSVSRLINTEPSELLLLELSEPIASESANATTGHYLSFIFMLKDLQHISRGGVFGVSLSWIQNVHG